MSDQATIDWRFFRHDNVLTVLMIARDRVYLVETEIVSKGFRFSQTPVDVRDPCVPGFEGREPGDSVPHFPPDQNPFLDEFMKLYNLPREAVLGYRETLYPVPARRSRTRTCRRRPVPPTAASPATSSGGVDQRRSRTNPGNHFGAVSTRHTEAPRH